MPCRTYVTLLQQLGACVWICGQRSLPIDVVVDVHAVNRPLPTSGPEMVEDPVRCSRRQSVIQNYGVASANLDPCKATAKRRARNRNRFAADR